MLATHVPIQRSVIADGRDHDDTVGGELPDLESERQSHREKESESVFSS